MKDIGKVTADIAQELEKYPQHLGVCALLFNLHGEVLLGKRKNAYKAGYYGLPGGRVELNEPLEASIRREIQEETGITVDDMRYLGFVRENQILYDFIHVVFIVEHVSQPPRLCELEKCEGWGWFDTSALPDPILPGHKAAIELFTQKKLLYDLTT